MPTTRRRSSKTKAQPQPRADVSDNFTPEVLPRSSSSSLAGLFNSPEFGLSWDNNVRHQVSRHLLHLRRFRGDTQADVAREMGTSQSAVAQIETGEGNFTAITLERMISALRGRFLVSILPEEFGFTRPASWWETHPDSASDWNIKFVLFNRVGTTDRALVGMERSDASIISTLST